MCFGSSGGGSTETRVVQNQNTLPAWAEEAGKSKYGEAEALTKRDYPTYTEPRLASQTPDQLAAFQKVRDTQGIWLPQFNKAEGQIDRASAEFDPSALQKFMNPYVKNVVDPTIEALNLQYDRGVKQRDLANSRVGTYGNDRNAVADALAGRERDNLIAQVVGQGYSQAFNQALGQYNTDKTQAFQAADAYGKLGTAIPGLNYQDATQLFQAGSSQQAQDQQNLSLRYEDFLKQFYYPQEQINFLTSTLGGTPFSTSGTSTQPVPIGSSIAQNVGALSALLGAGSMAYSAFK